MEATFGQNDQAGPGEEEAALVRVDGSGTDLNDRERVLEEVGSISIFFIGPELPPSRVEPDLEDTLSEFYKELQDLDTLDGAAETSGIPVSQSLAPSYIPLSLQPPEVPSGQLIPDGEQEQKEQGREQKQSSWPHWYDNRPYQRGRPRSFLPPRSEREEINPDQWQRPQSVNRPRPPPPRFHRPRLHRPTPPTAFPYRQYPPLPPLPPPAHTHHDWGSSVRTNNYDEEPGFPAFPQGPPPNFASFVSVMPTFDFERYFDQHQQGYNYDAAPSSSAGGSWRPYENEERYKWAAEPDPRDLRCPPANEDSSLVLILMRGLPGSGKSTLARELLFTGPSGLVLSTDDYFSYTDGYQYEQSRLGEAHEWNQNRAEDAMRDGRSPIIIDNTNIQAWEMKPYVRMALERGYRVDFCEPDTAWKFDPCELERRNKHGVAREKIAQMLDRFSFPVSVDIVMNSQEPPHNDATVRTLHEALDTMEEAASQLEREHVHSVYDKIAPYFNDSRYKAWPKVRQFLLDLQPGSIVADVGCGNGKYLHINKEVFKLGCDVCRPLVDAAWSQGHEVQVCDGLHLPYRDGCFDAVLSIAVIHHLSTKERRIRAIKEMARTLRVGGRIMIYVWAMEQKRRKFEKQDIFVPWNPNLHSPSDGGGSSVKPRRRAAAQSVSEATSNSDKHRKVRSTSSVADDQEEEEELVGAAPQQRTQRHWFFSRSLDSVFDFGSLAITRSFSRDGNSLSSPAGEGEKIKRGRGHGLIKQVSSFFLPPSVIGSEEDVFDAAAMVEEDLHKGEKSPGTGALLTPDSGFGSVALPDLIPLRNEHLKQPGVAGSPESTKSRQGSEEQVEVQAVGLSSCLRYYHVFREGELAELIGSHVEELRVTHTYFDHANWCVVAEKVQPWKI